MLLTDGIAPQRVAILRALQLGDMLCAIPALRALRAALPSAEITLVGLPWAAEITSRFSAYVDRHVALPGFPGLPEIPLDVQRFPEFLRGLHQARFDLAIQLHGNGRLTNVLVELFGATRSAGFFDAGGYCPDPAAYLPYPDHGSEVHRLLSLTTFLGAPPRGTRLEFPVTRRDRSELAGVEAIREFGVGEYVCLHPGGRAKSRRWPPERFAAVGDELARRGYPVIVTGTSAEQPLVREVLDAARMPMIDVSGQTSLGALAALVESAALLITNDTGVSHVAAALHTRSVVVFLGSDPDRWAPLDAERHRLVVPTGTRADQDQVVLAAIDASLTSR